MTFPLAGTGIWNHMLRHADPGAISDAAAELESLGFSALWIPDIGGDVFGAVEHLLRSTSTTVIANAKEAGTYQRPLAQTRQYLDDLDAQVPRLVDDDRVLAALGPKMLELA